MKRFNLMKQVLLGMVLVMLAASVWVSPAAAAAPDEPEYTGLEYALQLALLRVRALQDGLNYATEAADLSEQYIQEEKAAGYDTSDLEAALAELRASISEAQARHDTAAQILDEKAGFDENGQVVDPRQARDTLREAHRAMQDSWEILRFARQDYRQAMQDYLHSKRNP